MQWDIRDEWRVKALEDNVSTVKHKLYELDTLRSDVGNLQHKNRELSSTIDELRSELQMCKEAIDRLEALVVND